MLVKNLSASELIRRNQSRTIYSNYLVQQKLVETGQQIRLNLVGGSGGTPSASDILAIDTGEVDLTPSERDAVINTVPTSNRGPSAPVPRPTSAIYRYIMFVVTKVSSPTESPAVTEFSVFFRGTRVSWNVGVTSRFTNSAGVAFPDAFQGNLAGFSQGAAQDFVDGSLLGSHKAWPWYTGVVNNLPPNYMVIDAVVPVTFDAYSWATADHLPRDPVRWQVYGSNDRNTFTLLDDKTAADQTIPGAREAYLPLINLVF